MLATIYTGIHPFLIATLSFWLIFAEMHAIARSEDVMEIDYRVRNEGDKFFYVISTGKPRDQAAYVTVFEILGPEPSIRRLHRMDLANERFPKYSVLCGAGRFLVTVDEPPSYTEDGRYVLFDVREQRNVLGVYDLVRHESTTYRLKDMFTEEQIAAMVKPDPIESIEYLTQEDLALEGLLTERDWRQPLGRSQQHFDAKSLQFRIPLPVIESQPYSELNIDLPTRTVSIVKVDTPRDTHKEWALLPQQPVIVKQLAPTSVAEEAKAKKLRLPSAIALHGFHPGKTLKYKLDPVHVEYELVEP